MLVPPDAPDPTHDSGLRTAVCRRGSDHPHRSASRPGTTFNPNWFSQRWRVSSQRTDRDIRTQVNALRDDAGNYTSSLATGFAPRFGVLSDLGEPERPVPTGRSSTKSRSAAQAMRSSPTRMSPTRVREACSWVPPASPTPSSFHSPTAGLPSHLTTSTAPASIHQQGFNLADTAITFERQWSARLVASQDWIWTDNFNNASVRTSGYRWRRGQSVGKRDVQAVAAS